MINSPRGFNLKAKNNSKVGLMHSVGNRVQRNGSKWESVGSRLTQCDFIVFRVLLIVDQVVLSIFFSKMIQKNIPLVVRNNADDLLSARSICISNWFERLLFLPVALQIFSF